MKKQMRGLFVLLTFFGTAFADVPTGILRKPIPDKLVVLTFDDGPASGYTVMATARSLASETEISIAEGATLELKFQGEMKVGKLTLGGKAQPNGTYSAANAPQFIKGQGTLNL